MRNDIPEAATAPGAVAALPNHSIKLSPAMTGKLVQVNAIVGQFVHQGEIVAKLDSRQAEEQLQQAEASLLAAHADLIEAKANLTLALSNLNRVQSLYDAKLAPKKDVLTAENQVETSRAHWLAVRARNAQAAAANAQAATLLQWMHIESPIAGVVARRFLNVGDTADPSTPVVQIVDLSVVNIDTNLPADTRNTPRVGQPATIAGVRLRAPLEGTVTAVSPVIDPQTNAMPIQIRCVNPDGLLKEGETVTVSITLGIHHALTVPLSALVPDPNQSNSSMVYRVSSGVLTRVPVKTGIQWKNNVEILEGLTLGEMIVKSGAYGLPDGTAIDPIPDSNP